MNTIYPSDLKLNEDLIYSCSPTERNLLMIIISAISEHRKSKFTIPFSFLNSPLNNDHTPAGTYLKKIPSIFETLFKFSFSLHDVNDTHKQSNQPSKIFSFPFFSSLSLNDFGITVCLSPQFINCTRHWTNDEWTDWADLDTLTAFNSKYSLRLFLLLKKNKSPWTVPFSTYRHAMGFPSSYPTTSILERTEQSIRESSLLASLKEIDFIKEYGVGRGRPLLSLTFFYEFRYSESSNPSIPILEDENTATDSV